MGRVNDVIGPGSDAGHGPDNDATGKAAARDRARQRLAAVAPDADEAASLADRLLDLVDVHQALSRTAAVAGFVGVGHEPDTSVLLQRLHGQGVRVWLPVVMGRDLHWGSPDDPTDPAALTDGPWRLREPHPAHAELPDVCVVLVPALACDLQAHRLGRGAGFYDRTLRALLARRHPPLLVALVRDEAIVDTVPVEEHDVRMDLVVTPTRVIRAT